MAYRELTALPIVICFVYFFEVKDVKRALLKLVILSLSCSCEEFEF